MKPNRSAEPRRGRARPADVPWAKFNPGFSLIELMVVLALIVVLSVVSQGAMSGRKQRGLKAACAANLQKLHVAFNIYAAENNGAFPVVSNAQTSAQALALLVPRCTADTRSFSCPGTGEQKEMSVKRFASQTLGYSYYMGLASTATSAPLLTDAQVDIEAKTNGQSLFSASGKPPGSNHKAGGNILLVDGNVRSVGSNAPFPMLLLNNVRLLNPTE